jgi:aspartyl-tRNA(Asn)/glutamyl-tRNA(Gln) amidotransferase subunit A
MSRFPRTASTLVETAVALRSGATSASDLLTAATRRMGATRHLNAFIGGVLPRAIERAEASDERRRGGIPIPSGSATPASASETRDASSSSSFESHVGVEDRRREKRVDETETDFYAATFTTPRDPKAKVSVLKSLLDGVPIAVKDNFFVPGAPTTAGSKVLRGFVAPDVNGPGVFPGAFESAVTRRLAERGAVLFAKTNMDEFGMGSANAHSAFGRAVNPWRLFLKTDRDGPETDSETVSETERVETNRAPGGSSGGSAIAVASGVAVAAVGSDTGGSVRLPASYCGLVGLKPTYGRVSRWGLVPYCSSLDCPGFLTKTVADAIVLLSATQGKDASDPVTLRADARVDALARDVERDADEATRRALSSLSSSLLENAAEERDASGGRGRGFLKSRPGFPMAGWRVGIPAQYFVTELSDEVRRAWTATADVCEQMGASVVPVSLPNTRAALPAYYVIAPAEASSNLARYDGVRYGGDFSDDTKKKKKRGTRGTLPEESSDDSSSFSADDGTRSSSSSFREGATSFRGAAFGPEVHRRVMVGTFVSGSRRVARYAEKAMKVRRAVSDEFAEAFKKVDVILAPTAPTTAPPLFPPPAETMDDHGQIVSAYAADAMTVPASLAGLPAVSLPVGLGQDTGLPVGVQVIAARGNDADALGFAMRLEERIAELGDEGGGAGPYSALDPPDHPDDAGHHPPRGVVGWGERHRAVGVLEATRFEGGVM